MNAYREKQTTNCRKMELIISPILFLYLFTFYIMLYNTKKSFIVFYSL